MEDLSEASGLNQRAKALDPETVSETDVSQVYLESTPPPLALHAQYLYAAEAQRQSSQYSTVYRTVEFVYFSQMPVTVRLLSQSHTSHYESSTLLRSTALQPAASIRCTAVWGLALGSADCAPATAQTTV